MGCFDPLQVVLITNVLAELEDSTPLIRKPAIEHDLKPVPSTSHSQSLASLDPS
jgi:hypothetical protein